MEEGVVPKGRQIPISRLAGGHFGQNACQCGGTALIMKTDQRSK